ncbi:MAG: hypothetical protein JNM90_01625 [Burkholderiales bacterium]|nr:hypothetical protein [Burkholderiales bacterium]
MLHRSSRATRAVGALGALACALAPLASAHAQAGTPTRVEFEAGIAWQDRNDVQIPNDATGTRFALDRVTGSGPFFAPRVQFSTGLAPRHELRLVAAPLGIKESGSLDQAVNFNGQRFAAGAVQARYRFDSYRATWRYTFAEDRDWTWKAGLTGKIRSAEITLTQGGITTTRDDTGFVPLLHLYGERRLDQRSRLTFEGDGLAGGRGRAFDLTLRYVRDLGPRTSGFAGVRLLDGGADSSGTYNFARFHYVTFGLQYRL